MPKKADILLKLQLVQTKHLNLLAKNPTAGTPYTPVISKPKKINQAIILKRLNYTAGKHQQEKMKTGLRIKIIIN